MNTSIDDVFLRDPDCVVRPCDTPNRRIKGASKSNIDTTRICRQFRSVRRFFGLADDGRMTGKPYLTDYGRFADNRVPRARKEETLNSAQLLD
jgi:hypothetical protein